MARKRPAIDARIAATGRRLLLPDARTFADVFSRSTAYRPESRVISPRTRTGRAWNDETVTLKVGPFCSLSRRGKRGHLDVDLRSDVFDLLMPNTLLLDDTMHFEINVWDSRHALVSVSHNRIIGGTWLAVIDPRTIPAKAWR